MGFMYPEVLVVGQQYPLPGIRAVLSKVVSVAQMGLMFVGIGGNFVPAIRDHPLYLRFQANKMMFFLGGYFGLNMLQNSLSTTGAFQIYLNDRLIFSKIRTNRMPSVQEIAAFLPK